MARNRERRARTTQGMASFAERGFDNLMAADDVQNQAHAEEGVGVLEFRALGLAQTFDGKGQVK